VRAPPRPGRWPFILCIEVRWRDGTTTRHEVSRYATQVKAERDAVRARRAWSALLGAWHWPPNYLVIDQRTGHTVWSANQPEGNGNATTHTQGGREGSLF
jgi:hypothetical protein